MSAQEMTPEFARRFEAKVDRSGGPNACHLWSGTKAHGYGQIRVGGRMASAHRVAWEAVHGPLPSGKGKSGTCVLHRCDVPACVNVAHLFIGTNDDNVADRQSKGRQARTVGETNGCAKLTWVAVAEIRQRVAAGERRYRLAAEFGVSARHVGRIVSGTKWRSA